MLCAAGEVSMIADALRPVARTLIVHCLGFLVLLWAATGCGGDPVETGPADGPIGKQAEALAVTSPIELSAASDTAATGQVASWASGDFLAQWINGGIFNTQRYDSSGALLSSNPSIPRWMSVSGADRAGDYAFMTTASLATGVAAVVNFVSPADSVTSQVTLLDSGFANAVPGSLAINASGVVAATFWQGTATPFGAYLVAFSNEGKALCTASEPLGFNAISGSTAAVAVDGTGVIHVVLNEIGTSTVYYQRYSSTCSPLTSRVQVNTASPNYVWAAAVAADTFGNAVVAFEVVDPTFTSFDTYVQSFAANGTLVGGNHVVNDVGANPDMQPYDNIALGIMDTGPFVVAVPEVRQGQTSGANSTTCCDITVREFVAGGSLLDTFIASPTSVGATNASLAMAPSGDYWVGWQENTPAGQGYATSFWALGGHHNSQPPVAQMTDAEQYNFSVSGQESSLVYYAISVEPGAQALTIQWSATEGQGATTMYERLGGLPFSTLGQWDNEWWNSSETATVTIPNPSPGVYYFGFYSDFSSEIVANVSLLATAKPNFTISETSASLTVPEGTSGTSSITTGAVGGSGLVSLTASAPQGVGIAPTLSPPSVTADSSSTLSVAVAQGTAAGAYPITVTGTEGSFTQSTTVTVTVPPDFGISASPAAVTVAEGNTGISTIAIAAVNGSGSVSLTATGVPAGVSATFKSTSVVTNSSSTLTFAVSSSAAPGAYSITVAGTEGSISHTTTVTLTVPAPDFTLSASSSSLTVPQGSSGTEALTVTAVNSSGTVSLSASGAPAGVTATFSAMSVTATGSSTLTLAVGASTTPGTYTITVAGTEGSNAHSINLTLDVSAANFSILATPATLTVPQASSGSSTITTTAVSGSGTVSLTATGAPVGVAATLSSTSVTAGHNSTLTLTVNASTAPGTYTVTVTGTEGSTQHPTAVSLVVPAPDFTLSASTSSLTVPEGSSQTVTLSTALVGSPGTVSLIASAPSGITATLSASSVLAGGSSTLTVAVGAGTAPGSYAVAVTGMEGAFTQSVSISVIVPDFDISASPSTFKLARDTSATSSITTTFVGGEGTLLLAATGAPAGVTATFDVTSLQAGQSATLTLSVNASAVTGVYPITITGTEGTDVHTTTVTLTVSDVVLNPSFESGRLDPWRVSGTASISTTAYAGSYSAELGASTPTSGTSTLSQSFVMPATATKLSVWYDVTCPGTVATDWAGATLQDQVTGVIIVLLPDTCTLGQGWQQAIADVSSMAGDMVTLTLINQDGDASATSTLFDDVQWKH